MQMNVANKGRWRCREIHIHSKLPLADDSFYRILLTALQRIAFAALLCAPLLACKMTKDNSPHGQELPLFNPHRPDFLCAIETDKVPAVDAQADAWFLEARELEDPSIYEGDRDYKKIVQLTRLAADRHHWKAMLNLASLYLESRDPPHGAQDALKLVEEAMRLNIPAAYDRMGTYYMNGTAVNGDITKAYAFFQKAAEMGSPQAMTFLGEKISATWDNPNEGFWANIPVGTKMLECAFGQGNGQAAYHLHFLYARSRAPNGTVTGNGTREEKARALKMLHEGVKLGSADCARNLSVEFDNPDMIDMLAPTIDKARGERYAIFSNALSFNPSRRYPNLDKVLPLPPAKLPSWNGDKKTLIDAAIGFTAPLATPKPGAAAQFKGRHFGAAKFKLRPAGVHAAEPGAPA